MAEKDLIMGARTILKHGFEPVRQETFGLLLHIDRIEALHPGRMPAGAAHFNIGSRRGG
ncbi:MAG: hypothetical protein HFH26_13770 [Clostridiaceae bacterium]|nr:hypothetical protein [Clostridiaceae bacterium]